MVTRCDPVDAEFPHDGEGGREGGREEMLWWNTYDNEVRGERGEGGGMKVCLKVDGRITPQYLFIHSW